MPASIWMTEHHATVITLELISLPDVQAITLGSGSEAKKLHAHFAPCSTLLVIAQGCQREIAAA
jgi:hypothetical protein